MGGGAAVITNDLCINYLQYVQLLRAGYQTLLTSITPQTRRIPIYFSSIMQNHSAA